MNIVFSNFLYPQSVWIYRENKYIDSQIYKHKVDIKYNYKWKQKLSWMG